MGLTDLLSLECAGNCTLIVGFCIEWRNFATSFIIVVSRI